MSESALAKFLVQNKIQPTGDRKKDMELARPFITNYNDYVKSLSTTKE